MARNRGAAVAASADADSATTQRMRIPTNGPHDGDTLGPEITPAPGTVDFGAVRVPVPVGGTVSVEPTMAGHVQAVHVTVPEGRLSVSALAAPRTGGLWSDLATEIDASLREGGARVRSFTGEWGRELHATTDGATSVFVGVDGPRWMLYGVATGPTRDAVSLDARLRRMLRGTVVVRGKAPYPVRTVLPLAMPSEGVAEQQAAASAPPTMTLRAPAGAVSNGSGPNASVNGTASPHHAPAGRSPAAALPTGVPPRQPNGALPAAAGAGPSGIAANGVVPGPAPNGATTGVLRTNGATRTGGSRAGASRTGRTRTGIPPVGASTTGATPTGAARSDVPAVGGLPRGASSTGGARTDVPTVGDPVRNASTTGGARAGVPPIGASTTGATRTDQPAVPPPNAAISRAPAAANGAAGPGVPLLGAPTSGAPRSAGARTGPAGTGGNRLGGSTTGANRTGANAVGATNTGATWSGGYPTAAMPPTDAEPGTSPYGMPANGAPHQHATTGGTPRGHGLSPTAGAWGGAAPAGPAWPPAPAATPGTGSFPTDAAQNRPNSSGRTAGHPNPTDPHGTPRAHGQAPTGGFPRPAVPAAWAHETGGHPRWSAESAPGGVVGTPPPAGAASMTPLSTGAAAITPPPEPSAPPPAPPVAASSAPQPEIPWSPSAPEPQPEILWSPSAPEPQAAAWQSPRVEPPRAAPERDSGGHWDPLVDPLPVDLDPLPAPGPTWDAARSNGRYDAVFDSGPRAFGAPHRGAPDGVGAATNGVAASRRRPADLLRDRDDDFAPTGGSRWRAADLLDGRNDAHRDAEAAGSRWRAADLLAGRDERVSGGAAAPTWRAADLLAGRDERVSGDAAPPTWRAADLLAGREDRLSGDAARPTWRAAELLAGRDQSDSPTTGRATDSAAGWDRLDAVPDRAARSRQATDGHADGAGTGMGASRWQAADLLDDRDRAGHTDGGGGSRRRRSADTPDGRRGTPESPDGLRGRTAAADHGRGVADRIGTDASRWRAADLLDGHNDAHHEGEPAGSRWRAADLLAGDSGTLDDGTGTRRRARTSDVGTRQSADATPLWSAVGTGSAEPYPDTRAGRRRSATAREELIRPTTLPDDGPGRRYGPTAATTRHDVGAGHHDDAQPRHGGGNRHTSPPRVPPTQWAWPKEPDLGSAEAPRARGADDDAWSAADLLDEGRHAGGRRRAPESARHVRPDTDHAAGAGRHYSP